MSRLWPTSIGILSAVLLGMAAPEEEESVTSLRSADAKKALADYEAALKRASERFEKEAEVARKKLLTELEEAQEKATKANALDDALAIRNIRRDHESNLATPLRAGKRSIPMGKWRMVTADGVIGTYDFRANGAVSWKQKVRRANGKCTVKAGDILIVYDDNRIERLTPCGDRMIVEHFNPSSTFPDGYPQLFAYAEKVK